MTVTDDDRAYAARRLRDLKALIQEAARKANLRDPKRHAEPKPEWLHSRPRGSMRCEPGAAIMRSGIMQEPTE